MEPAPASRAAGRAADQRAGGLPDTGRPQQPELTADCSRCAGLCCVAPSFAASSDFAISKAAGQRCRNLADDFGCAIHAQLRERGFPGCTVYDCFGAGQHVTQVTLGGRTWRQSPDLAGTMFTAFEVVRALHETLWYLTEALELPEAKPLAQQLHQAYEATLRHTLLDPQALGDLDLRSHRDAVAKLLGRTSALARSGQPAEDRSLRGADLVGRGFAGMDLRGADFRGALLLGADLRDTDLRRADLLGADLRGADLRGADLSTSLFLTLPQASAARGSAATRLPAALRRPAHWDGR